MTARQLLTSDHLDEALPFIDRDILNKQIKNCLENKNLNFGDNLCRLISIDQYLELQYDVLKFGFFLVKTFKKKDNELVNSCKPVYRIGKGIGMS